MAGIKCIHCNYVGVLEHQGITFDGETGDKPISRSFKHKGNNPFSGNLHYECPRCETIILIAPMDVLGAVGAEILTDVREKPRGRARKRKPGDKSTSQNWKLKAPVKSLLEKMRKTFVRPILEYCL